MKTTKGKTSNQKSGKRTQSGSNGRKRSATGKDNRENQMEDNSNESSDSELMDFFLNEVRDMYGGEKQLLKALPKMARAASTDELRSAIENHQAETEGQVTRLDEVFALLNEKPSAIKCEGLEGIIKEGTGAIEDTEEGTMTRDAALIISAQKVEHYEIASYGSLRTLAQVLGLTEAANLFEATLEEEKNADQKLTEIAESFINTEATQE